MKKRKKNTVSRHTQKNTFTNSPSQQQQQQQQQQQIPSTGRADLPAHRGNRDQVPSP